jgi:hypothetical protein
MERLVPVVRVTLGASPELATKLAAGLRGGLYERMGGVVRRTDDKSVVVWLRGMPDVNQPLGALLRLNAASSLLNLSLPAAGFAVVLERLNGIEQRLVSIQSVR